METKFNFKSQISTSIEQSRRLLALGLKKETADMGWGTITLNGEPITFSTEDSWDNVEITEIHIPAWSLHRLIEILDTNPFVFYLNCGYDTVIDHVEEYIKSGFIDTRYLEEWCLNEEE